MSTLAKEFVKGVEEGKIEGIKEGIKEGEIKGEIKGKIEGEIKGRVLAILTILSKRFKNVPHSISRSLNLYSDPIALESLTISALDCETLEEFEQELAH
jgi:flagellar biosynthesis/type III secretory pathway protein FliH